MCVSDPMNMTKEENQYWLTLLKATGKAYMWTIHHAELQLSQDEANWARRTATQLIDEVAKRYEARRKELKHGFQEELTREVDPL